MTGPYVLHRLGTSHPQKESTVSRINKRTVISMLSVLALSAGTGAGVAQAKHGADDPVGHHRNDDRGGLRGHSASRGHDDPADHDAGDDNGARRGRGGNAGGGHHDRVDND
jgi:hypothetical protein